MKRRAIACVLLAGAGCGSEPAPQEAAAVAPTSRTEPADPRLEQYRVVKSRARAWIDGLEVDPVELIDHGVKGKKKLGEVLEAYVHFRNATDDPQERAVIQQRVVELARHTDRPEYHNLQTAPGTEFNQNSMSYFRVLALMEEFGLDTSSYRLELDAVKVRMDEHLARRGQWQRAMFREYYERFGLERPPALANLTEATGVLAQRLPADQVSMVDGYRLSHQVFVAFDYGHRKVQDHLSADDLSYLRTVLPALLRRTQAAGDPDLLAEYVSCVTYFGWHDEPAYRDAVDALLFNQNANGTWGNYEQYRARMGTYVDQHLYLHTTMVAMRALIEIFESDWGVVF